MLLDTIRALFQSRATDSGPPRSLPVTDAPAQPESLGIEPVALAACVLLLDLAHADGEFSPTEEAHLERVLERHFGLPAATAHTLIEEAERERQASVDHFRFTSIIKNQYDVGQKMVLAEVMWGLVLADGQISDHEHYLTRKISNLLDLEPAYLSAAKAAAAKRVD